MTLVESILLGLYFLILAVLSMYGSHRYWMAFLYYRHKYKVPTPKGRLEKLPKVTIQLPIFNEMYVVERLVDAVCKIDYPRELLEIQVLDDSTDETSAIAEACVRRHQALGLDVVFLHRTNRQGFKAGALEEGLKKAKGEFVAVFDADFVAQPDFLQKTVPYFADPKVGMVQVRWEHINREFSTLTQARRLPRRALHDRAHRPQPLGALLQLQRHRRHLAAQHHPGRRGAGSTTPLTRTWTCPTAPSSRAGSFVYLNHVVSPAEIPVDMNASTCTAAPLGQGVHPDRAQAPCRPSSRPTCRSRSSRECLHPHLTKQHRLPADGGPEPPDSGLDGHPLSATAGTACCCSTSPFFVMATLSVSASSSPPARVGQSLWARSVPAVPVSLASACR
jgi:hypothetical protein